VEVAEHHVSALLLAVVAVAVAGAAIFLAFRIYGGDRGLEKGRVWAQRFPGAHRLLSNKYYVDEIYDATVIRGFWATARGLFRFDAGFIDGFLVNGTRNLTVNAFSLGSGLFDKYVVDGLVNLIGTVLDGSSRGFRRLQTGYVANYALVLVAGMFVLICVYMVWRLS
jgi:NADH-quinone oxidoreductase subunit L